MARNRTQQFILDAVASPAASFQLPVEDALLRMSPDPTSGIAASTRFYFNDEIPALDDNKLFGACTARPLGVDLQCSGAAALYSQMRERADEKQQRSIAASPWPLPGGGGFATEFFKKCHPDYDPFPTDGLYFQNVTLGLQKAAKHSRGFVHWARNCKPCAAGRASSEAAAAAAAAEKKKKAAADGEKKKAPAAAAAAGAASAPAKPQRVRREPARPNEVHTCAPADMGPSILQWSDGKEDLALNHPTIFTEFGSRNNLRQLLKGAAAAGLYRFHVCSLINNMAIHAWLTINGRWLRAQSQGPEAFNPLLPPFIALIFRIRDMRDPSSPDAVKLLRTFIDKGCNMIDAATKLPLSSFIVLVAWFVESFVKRTGCLVLPADDGTSKSFDSGALFGSTLQDVAVNIGKQFSAQFDSMTWRFGWIQLACSDLYRQWRELEVKATNNPNAFKTHQAVETSSRSTGFKVVPPGQTGTPRLYERIGGCQGTAPGEAAMQSLGAWFYTAYLPVYLASLLLTPERPPLCTDRFYFAIDPVKPPAPLGLVLFNEAMFSSSGKYGKTEAAKESHNKNTLGTMVGSAGARPDELSPVRARFSYINARPKQQGHAESSALRRENDEKDREFRSSNPRVILLPSLLVGNNVKLPWHDPNEGAIEHLLPEYVQHCIKWFGDGSALDAYMKTLAPKGDAEVLSAFDWHGYFIARGDRSDFDMYLIKNGVEEALEDKKQQPQQQQSFYARLAEQTNEVCGGQALCEPANTLLRAYIRFLRHVCVLRRVDLAIGAFVALDKFDVEATHRVLVDGARVFRARALGLAAKINDVYRFGDGDFKARARSRVVRTVFIKERIRSVSLPPADTATRARLEELLAEILLNPAKKFDEVSIEDQSVSIQTLAEHKITVDLVRGGTFHLVDVVCELARDFDVAVRVPAAVLGPFLSKSGDATVIKKQARMDETEPFRDGPLLTAIHATRHKIKSLHPRVVLSQLGRLPPQLEIILAATALENVEIGVAATLDSFWKKARAEGLEAEIQAAAKRVLAPPPAVAAAAAVGSGAGFIQPAQLMESARVAKETPEEVTNAARIDLQFTFVVDKSRLPEIVKSFAKRLFAAFSRTIHVKTPQDCVHSIELLVPTGNSLSSGGFGTGQSSKKRKREEAATAWSSGSGKQPLQKKIKRSADTPEEADAEVEAEAEGDDWNSMREAMSSSSGSGSGGKEAKESS